MNTVVLGLGGNMGDIKASLLYAIELIHNKIGSVDVKSSVYETAAWGVEDQANFLNQVIIVNTSLEAKEVLKYCLSIEKQIGRDRLNGKKWSERVIDIDILFYNNDLINLPELTVPHPFIQERNFVLDPLVEILPKYVHPSLEIPMLELKKSCKDKMQTIRLLA
jgi:2-amino-4-hydroxy-6-hydroxymethyldihydropteridine diphosphokinase